MHSPDTSIGVNRGKGEHCTALGALSPLTAHISSQLASTTAHTLQLNGLQELSPIPNSRSLIGLRNGLNNVTLEGLFERDGNVRTRNNGQKLLLRNFKTSQAMNFFPVKIAATWNQLPENIVSAGTVNTFKNRLDKFWITNPPSTTSY
ncbi:hypothetical protein FHG87_011640 [Trinorchestia longiramus]|nr:hypothetical protein FHG87_011640 [Trinorchestia longiramus]